MDTTQANPSSPNLQLKQVKISAEEAYKRSFDDFQFYSEIALPDVCAFTWPNEFLIIWALLVKAIREKDQNQVKRVIRFALGLPRGFAKTTFIKLLVTWLIVYDFVNFPLVVCSTEAHAENFIADVHEILCSANMTSLYGNWEGTLAIDSAKMKKGMYRRRTVVIAAIGSGTSVRGLNVAHERPDFIICDDMQTRENAESDTEAVHLLNWFVGTLLKCVDPIFAVVAYIGNMYPQNCILYKLKENPYWQSLITGCILADSRSLWEALRPLEALFEDFKHDEALGLAHIWFAEMMNDPILERLTLLPKGSVPIPLEKLEDLNPEAGFIVIDPAGFKEAADDNVILAVLVMNGIPYAVGMECGKLNPKEVIEATLILAHIFSICVIFVEGQAYQQTLCFWFNEELKRAGLSEHFHIRDVTPSNRSKDSRIRVFIQQLLAKTAYILNPEVRQRFVYQAIAYKIGKKKNKDDILDAHAYIEDIRTNPEYWALVHAHPLGQATQNHARVVGNNAPI